MRSTRKYKRRFASWLALIAICLASPVSPPAFASSPEPNFCPSANPSLTSSCCQELGHRKAKTESRLAETKPTKASSSVADCCSTRNEVSKSGGSFQPKRASREACCCSSPKDSAPSVTKRPPCMSAKSECNQCHCDPSCRCKAESPNSKPVSPGLPCNESGSHAKTSIITYVTFLNVAWRHGGSCGKVLTSCSAVKAQSASTLCATLCRFTL